MRGENPTDIGEEPAAFTIAKFDKARHDRSAFSCGFAPIDNFLKLSLSDQIKDGMIAAWIAAAADDPAVPCPVLGFYTLGAMAVRANLGPKPWQRAGVPDIPVIYIRAVAVREDMQGKQLGTALVVDALRRCISIASQMGAAAAVLDVLDGGNFERRWKFYADLGFAPLGDPDNPRRVYVSMATVWATLG